MLDNNLYEEDLDETENLNHYDYDDFDELDDFDDHVEYEEDYDDDEDYDYEDYDDDEEDMTEEELLKYLSDSDGQVVESVLNEDGDDIDLEKIVKNSGVFDNHVYIPEKVMSITEVPRVLLYNLIKKGIVLFMFMVFLVLAIFVKMRLAPIILLVIFNIYLLYGAYIYYKILVGGRFLIVDAKVTKVIDLVDEILRGNENKRAMASYKRLVVEDVEGNLFNFKVKLRKGEFVEEGSSILVYVPSVIDFGPKSNNGYQLTTILDYELK